MWSLSLQLIFFESHLPKWLLILRGWRLTPPTYSTGFSYWNCAATNHQPKQRQQKAKEGADSAFNFISACAFVFVCVYMFVWTSASRVCGWLCLCLCVCMCLIRDVAAGEARMYRFVVDCSIEHRRVAVRLCSPGWNIGSFARRVTMARDLTSPLIGIGIDNVTQVSAGWSWIFDK